MTYTIWPCDCRTAMSLMDADSVDSIVTDPPYGLSREPDMAEVMRHWLAGDDYEHGGSGFMGKSWDSFVPGPAVWREAYRILKPGGHLVAFFGTRTYDLGVMALRLAGFEVRDQLAWVFGQGFPKSHDISRKLEKDCCLCTRQALPNDHARAQTTPEHDLRLVPETDLPAAVHDANQPYEVLQQSVPQCRLPTTGERAEPEEGVAGGVQSGLEGRGNTETTEGKLQRGSLRSVPAGPPTDGAEGRLHYGAPNGDGENVWVSADANRSGESYRPQPGQQSPEQSGTLPDERRSQAWGGWPICSGCGKPNIPEGLGTALKPAYEPIVLCRKPLSERTVAANVLRWGTGAVNIDGCRVGDEVRVNPAAANKAGGSSLNMSAVGMPEGVAGREAVGRWPANLAHDGSPEVLAQFPDSKAGVQTRPKGSGGIWSDVSNDPCGPQYGDSGSAGRFFYCAKASKADRNRGLDDMPEQPSAASQFRPNHAAGAAAGENGNPYGRWSPVRNTHPTVKPTALMQWLVRLVTPPGGTVLDPFMGSGSTGVAAVLEHFDFIGCEMTDEYVPIATARIDNAVNARYTPEP